MVSRIQPFGTDLPCPARYVDWRIFQYTEQNLYFRDEKDLNPMRSYALPSAITIVSSQSTYSHPLQASTNYKEAFALFDKRGNGRVTLESLGDLLRACGQNPTLAEIRDLEKGVGGDCEFFHCATNTE